MCMSQMEITELIVNIVYEPYLIFNGFINRTPRGRVVTEYCYKHFGLEYTQN